MKLLSYKVPSLSPGIRALRRAGLASLLVVGFCISTTATVQAAPQILQIDKFVDRTTANVPNGEVFSYTLRYACSSTTTSATSAVITDVLPASLELVSLTSSPHVATATYVDALRTVFFTMVTPLPAGSTGEVRIQARFRSGTTNGTVASNTATFTAINSAIAFSPAATITADVPVVTAGTGIEVYKYASRYNVYAPSGDITYTIYHGAKGDTAASPIANYFMEDPIPAGLIVDRVVSDRFPGTDNPVYLKFKTNTRPASWLPWSAGSQWRSGDSPKYLEVSTLGLAAGEYVTAIRLEYGNLPAGVGFTQNNQSNPLYVSTHLANPAALTAASRFRNCADTYGSTVAGSLHEQSCTDTYGTDPSLVVNLGTYDPNWAGPYSMGQVFNVRSYVELDLASLKNMDDPKMYIWLPAEFEYVGNPVFSGWGWESAGRPLPATEVIPDYNGTGRTLVRFKWGGASPMHLTYGDWKTVFIDFQARVKPNRVADGWYSIEVYADWLPSGSGFWNFVDDSNDLDGDSSTTDKLAKNYNYWQVQTGNGAAGLDAVMWVKGELDSAFNKYPSNGQTTPSGRMDYELRLNNPTGVLLDNLVIIDILPTVGDKGVIDLSPRNSQWSPYLVGPVAGPPGATVYYSLSSNPCRDELTPGIPAGCDPPNWSSTPPVDITTVRSLKFDFGSTKIYPNDPLVIGWPMAAPANAPTAGQIAWNSFGFKARRADSGLYLLPSEPAKTGIAIRPPNPPFYGDFVWNDLNQDGLQTAGEPGINGIRIELYRDNGDGKPDPLTDTMVQFTATANNGVRDGAYLFGNLTAGNYFAVVKPGGNWAPTKNDVGTANDVDSDGAPTILAGARAAIMPVTTLDTLEEDRTWDQGLYDRSGVPAVWAIAPFSNGNMMLGGRFTTSHGLARKNIVMVNSSGVPVATFAPGAGFDGDVRSVAVNADGTIFVGGSFAKYNNTASYGLALLKQDGQISKTLAIPDRNDIRWVGSNSDGMYFSGTFNKVGATNCGNIARLKSDGKLDTSFNTTNGADGPVYSAGIQSDKNLVIAGAFTKYAGVNRGRVARVRPNGSLDTTFDPGAGANGPIFSVRVLTDGRIILTGSFNQFSGVACNGAVRLLPTGSVDPALSSSPLKVESIQTSN